TDRETARAKATVAATPKPPARAAASRARVARKTSTRTVRSAAAAPRKAAVADLPDTPLSRAAAKIAKQLGTTIRGATRAELEALDAIKKEGNWEIGGRTVHLTNLDKLLFPEDRYSKRDLIRYYVQVAPVMIPHYRRRPLSM